MRSPRPWTLLIACSVFLGCGVRYSGNPPTATDGGDSSPVSGGPEQPANDPAEANSHEDNSATGPGWPAGDDTAESFNALGENIRSIFDTFELVEETKLYPIGFTKLKRVVNELHQDVDQESEPRTGTVHITYTKHFTILHKTREAVEADHDVYPANPMQTAEAMQGLLNPKQSPMALEMTYTIEGDRWVRTGYAVEPSLKETANVPKQMDLP